MRNRIFGILAFSFLTGLAGLVRADEPGEGEPIATSPGSAGPASVAQHDSWKFIHQRGKWLPQFELTGRPGSNDIHGFSPDLVIPIAQNSRNLIFTNVIGSLFWDDSDDFKEINVGLGYRRLMGDSSWILGGYAYWDRIWSRFDNTFDQAELGIEGLSWNWEGRVNGYIAPEDTQFVPATGISQATLVGATLVMSPRIEQAMSGVDAELGWRLPFFGEDGLLSDTRIFAGGFYFDAPDLKGCGGPMTRFETRMWQIPFLPEESRLTLGASYRWDKYREDYVQGQIGVRIPLGQPDRAVPLGKVERRMVDRPVRDISIVTRRGNATREQVRTRTAIIEDTYFFAYYRDGETDGDGSFDNPWNVHNAAASGENNLLIGLSNEKSADDPPYDPLPPGYLPLRGDTVDSMEGQTWMGGGTALTVWGVESGQPAIYEAPGTPPTFCCTGSALKLAGNNTVEGLYFERIGTALSHEGGDTMFDIYNNRFRGVGERTAIHLGTDGTLTAYLHDNIHDNLDSERMGTGVYVYGVGSFDITIEAYGNDFSNINRGLTFQLSPSSFDEPSSFSLNAHDNTFTDMDEGIATDVSIFNDSDYTHISRILNNTFSGVRDDNGDTDYHLYIDGNCGAGEVIVDVDVDGNRSTEGSAFAIVKADYVWNGALNLDVTNNEVLSTSGHAILVDVDEGPDVNLNVSSNEIRHVFEDPDDAGPDHDGIEVRVYDSWGNDNTTAITIADNIVEDIGDDGIDVDLLRLNDAWEQTTLTIAGNEVTRSRDNGIEVDLIRTDSAEITIDDNLVQDSGDPDGGFEGEGKGNGIEVMLDNSGDEGEENTITISNNTIERTDGENAIEIDIENGSYENEILIDANTIEIANQNGVDIWIAGLSSENSIEMNDNNIDVVQMGIEIENNDLGTYLDSDSNNVVEDADTDAGISGSGYVGTLLVNGNEVPTP